MYQQGIGLPITQLEPSKPKDTYPVYTGRMIYDQLTISGLNRVPVEMHKYRALRGISADSLPVKPEEMVELLLVEGSPVFHWNEEAEWEPITNIITADDESVYQLVMGERGYILRHYARGAEVWVIYDTPLEYWAASGKETDEAVGFIPIADFRVYENGRGILYPNQWTYQRLEEIRWNILQETSDFALSLLIIGMVSPNPEDALAKLEAGRRIANIPGQGATVQRVGDSRIPDQLDAEYQRLESEYFRACYLFDMSQQPDRPVGLDLQLRLEPQSAYIEDLRRKMVECYAMLDYTAPIRFAPVETLSMADKLALAQTMISLTESRLIDTTRASEIIADAFPR